MLRRAFKVTELLVAIAVVGALFALPKSASETVRETARRLRSPSQLAPGLVAGFTAASPGEAGNSGTGAPRDACNPGDGGNPAYRHFKTVF